MSSDLMNAILAMNSYSDPTSPVSIGMNIGAWTRVTVEDFPENNFSGSVYRLGDQYVVAYRGTTDLLGLEGDILNGYGVGGGSPYAPDATRAINLYKQTLTQAGDVAANVTLTGHSMGGGLAGYVAALYGAKATVFDNMAFEQAASRAYDLSTNTSSDPNFPALYDADLKNRIYGAGLPVEPNASYVNGWYTEGEFLAFNRWNATRLPNPLDPHSGSSLSMGQLHSQSLLVMLLYAETKGLTGWEKIAPFLLPNLYDDFVAKAAGADQFKAAGSSSADTLREMIAYSALDSGVLPFGSVALKAFFNDAKNISEFVYSGSEATSEVDKIAYEGISQIIAQYSGQLAAQKSIDANSADGIVSVTDKVATVSLNPLQWETWTGGSVDIDPNIVGLDHLVTGAVTSVVQPNINEDAKVLFDDLFATDADELISGITLIQITDEAGAKLDGVSAGLTYSGEDGGALQIGSVDNPTTFVGGAGTNIMIGQFGDETGERSDKFDLSVGNNIILESKAGTATLDFTAIEDVAPDTWNMVIGGYGGSQTFVFENPEHAPLTIVYGASNSDTFDIKSDPDTDVAVYVLEFSDVTEANFLSLDPDLIEKYLDEKYDLGADSGYGPAFDEKIVLINPSAEDILKYNGDVIDDPTSYEAQTTVNTYAHSFYDEGGLGGTVRKVDPDNYLKMLGDDQYSGGVRAAFTDTWTVERVTESGYGLISEDNNISYRPGEMIIKSVKDNSSSEEYHVERYDGYHAEVITDTREFYDGSLSVFGFRHGDFGVNFQENNYTSNYSENTITYSVSEWSKATVGTTELPHTVFDEDYIVPDIVGQLPATLGETLSQSSNSDQVSGSFATNADYDLSSAYDRIVLELVDFARASEIEGTAGANNMSGTRGANVIRSSGGDDTVFGLGGDDELVGGEGSDALSGGEGSDTYTYFSGDGNDVINDGSADPTTSDILSLKDLDDEDVTKSRIDNNLVITVSATGETITVENQFIGYEGVEKIQFAGGVAWSRSDINAGLQDEILGTPGDDILTGTSDDDIFRGGLGDDQLFGAGGSDIYIYSAGDGSDYIDDEANEANSIDTLRFLDVNAVDVVATRDGVNLDITVIATGDVITIDEQWYSDAAYWGFEKIEFADGSFWDRSALMAIGSTPIGPINGTAGDDTLTGTSGADTFVGGLGNDLMLGGQGADIYIYARGDGTDYIDDEANESGSIDTLRLTDLNASDIAASRNGVNLEITILDTGDVITIDEQWYNPASYWGFEKIEFSDGSSWDRSVLMSVTPVAGLLVGTSAADTLTGTTGNDIIAGIDGNDLIFGGAGDDRVSGGDGDDLIRPGTGNDTVDGGTGSDTITFDGRGTDFTVSVVDSTTVRVDGDGVSTLISNSEWIIFDAPEGEADQSIDVVDFIEQNGDEQQARSSAVAMAVSLDPPAAVTYQENSPSPAELASADIIAFPASAITISDPGGYLGSFDGIGSQGEDGSSSASADIISLEDFIAGLQAENHNSDLWFEPEPIGALV